MYNAKTLSVNSVTKASATGALPSPFTRRGTYRNGRVIATQKLRNCAGDLSALASRRRREPYRLTVSGGERAGDSFESGDELDTSNLLKLLETFTAYII